MAAQSVPDTDRSDYSLLWEITGKDLPAPSYVFGSMHVRYKSAFEFPDSLLLCLQACDAVANEIHLDSAMHRIVELYVGQEEVVVDSSYIQFIHEKILQPDTNKAAVTIDSLDFRSLLKGLGEGMELRKSGFMATMLDAYLMEVGRSLGKKRYGLEQIENHLYEKENTDFPDYRLNFSWLGRSTDELLRLYYAGDLDPIAAFIESDPSQFNELSLIARNYIMVQRMTEIMHGERLFSIVGAAHLPGEEGVLELLRKEGYTLRRVTPTFTGLRDSFYLPEIERPWPEYKSANEVYSFAMPLDFLYENTDGTSTSYFSFDIGRGASYVLTASSVLPLDYEDFDDEFFVQDGYEIVEKTPLVHQGMEGFSYRLTKLQEEFQYYQAYTFNYDQTLYYLQVGVYEESTLEGLAGVATFLEKFKLLKKNREKWAMIRDTLGGFAVSLPDHYHYTRTVVKEGFPYDDPYEYPLYVYHAGFEAPAASVWCQYYDYLPGQQWENEATQLQEGLSYLEASYGIDLQVTRRDTFQGFPRWLLNGELTDHGLQFSGQLIARGNRLYLLSQLDLKSGRKTKKFLPSFQLLPLAISSVHAIEVIEEGLSITLPTQAKAQIIDLREDAAQAAKLQYQIQAVDPANSANYLVDVFFYPALISIRDSLTFLEQGLAPLLGPKDQLQEEKVGKLASGQVVYERTYSTGHAQLQKRIQYYHYGRYWVRKQMIATKEILAGLSAQVFFTEDDWRLPPSSFELFSPRSVELFTGLQTRDSLQLMDAVKVLDPSIAFNQDDLPALRKVFLDNSWEKYHQARQIVNRLIPAFLAEGEYGQQVLQQIYKDDQLDTALRTAIIAGLSAAERLEAYPLLFRLLEEEAYASPTLAETALMAFDQNPSLTLEYWPSFHRLLASGNEPLVVWELARQVLAQDPPNNSPVLASQQLFVDRGRQLLDHWEARHGKKLPETVFDLYRMFPAQEEVLALAHSLYERPQVDWASLAAASYLFDKQQLVSKRKWKQILKIDSMQVPFLRLLNEYNLLDKVGGRYYEQETIARYLFMEKMAPNGMVTDLDVLDVVEVVFRGEVRRAYVFSFTLEEEKNRLGVVGFFSRDLQQRSFLDEELVNYTLYPIHPRRRASKATQLLEELGYDSDENGVYMEVDSTYTPFK